MRRRLDFTNLKSILWTETVLSLLMNSKARPDGPHSLLIFPSVLNVSQRKKDLCKQNTEDDMQIWVKVQVSQHNSFASETSVVEYFSAFIPYNFERK